MFFFLFLLRSPSPNILNILKNQKSIFLHFYPKFRSSILIECKAKFIEKKISIEFNFCFKFQIYFPSDRGRVKFQTKFVSHIFLSFFFFLSGEKKHSTKSSNVTVTRERRTGKEQKKKKKGKSNEKVDVTTLSFNQLRNTIERKVYVWWSVCPWMYLWCLC